MVQLEQSGIFSIEEDSLEGCTKDKTGRTSGLGPKSQVLGIMKCFMGAIGLVGQEQTCAICSMEIARGRNVREATRWHC